MKTNSCSLHTLIAGSSLLGIFAFGLAAAPQARGLTLWTGPMISFTEAPGSNPFLPANQDRLTPDVWITRNTTQGLFNAFSESGYSHFFSPQNTLWAYGILANFSLLPYRDWEDWYGGSGGGGPPSTIGRLAVIHMVSDDIYVQVEFTSWGGSGGGFSYLRSTSAVPEPTSALLLLGSLAVAGVARRRTTAR